MDSRQGPWSLEEDMMLQNLMDIFGMDWSLISKSIPGRTIHECLLWWFSFYQSFTPEEGEMFKNLFEKHGPNWSLISKSIPGKSAISCELRWKSSSVTKKDIPDLNLSLAVGGVSGHQAPSISDMARDNMSSEAMAGRNSKPYLGRASRICGCSHGGLLAMFGVVLSVQYFGVMCYVAIVICGLLLPILWHGIMTSCLQP
ncbi:transcription factor MYB44-like protein [Tanacetum coccineum]